MPANSVTVGRRKYVAGLEWQVSPSGRTSDAAKEAVKQSGGAYDAFAVRQANKSGRLAQFGLGAFSAGVSLGMASIAGSIAGRLPGSWAGAFRLREGIIILVVRDDLITPDGDQLFLDESEARQRLLQEISLGGLQKVYAPEAWSMPSADNMSLVLLLQDHAECFLQPATIPKAWVKYGIIIGGVLAVLIIGGLIWQTIEQERTREAQAKMEAERQAQLAAEQQLPSGLQPETIQYPPPVRYWEAEPEALALVNACRQALQKEALAYYGWELGTVSCTKDGLSLSWSHKLESQAVIIPGTTPDPALQAASKTIPLEGLAPRGKQDLIDPEMITRLALAQNWRGQLARADDDPPPPCPPEIPPEQWNPPPPPWVKRRISTTQPDLPGELPTYFTDIPGVIINSLTYQGENWSIEGVIYENRR